MQATGERGGESTATKEENTQTARKRAKCKVSYALVYT